MEISCVITDKDLKEIAKIEQIIIHHPEYVLNGLYAKTFINTFQVDKAISTYIINSYGRKFTFEKNKTFQLIWCKIKLLIDFLLSNPPAMGDWCKEHHGASGLTAACLASKVSLQEAENMLLDFIQEHCHAQKVCWRDGKYLTMSFIDICWGLWDFMFSISWVNHWTPTMDQFTPRSHDWCTSYILTGTWNMEHTFIFVYTILQ